VRSVFLVSLIPCFFSQALCSACALVSAAVLGRLASLPFGVDILITRDIPLAPAEFAGERYQFPQRMSWLEDIDDDAQPIEVIGSKALW
jgi:hypothetical protein